MRVTRVDRQGQELVAEAQSALCIQSKYQNVSGVWQEQKQEHGEGRWDFGCPTVEHSEVPILLLLTEGVGWMASHFLR